MAERKKASPGRERRPETTAPEMLLLYIVYSNAVDEEITEIVTRHAGGYTRFAGVFGEGNREPHLGTHVWPSMNNCMMVAVEAPRKEGMTEEIFRLKDKFSGVGISVFVTRLEEMR